MDKNIFKAYDIRGKYPKEINEATVSEICAKLAGYFKKGELVVGHDVRKSSPRLYKTAIRALEANNPNLVLVKLGLITTPLMYFLVSKAGAKGGIMVTASHNPKEYNGLKVVGKNSERMSGKEIYSLISQKTSAKK